MFKFRGRIKNWGKEIEPDEIFLDAENIPAFNKQQFEGRLEKPISKRAIFSLGVVFFLIILIFSWKVFSFQVVHGQEYQKISENISLKKQIVFAERGIIYDRNNIPLAWNELNPENPDFSKRIYADKPGLAHVLGYVGYPEKDNSGFYWQKDFVGKDGAEKEYNQILNGKNGVKIIETNVRGEAQSENVIAPPESGRNLTLSIDSRVQSELFKLIEKWASAASFKGGSGVIIDINTGEILALTNFPEYDPNIMSAGDDSAAIRNYLEDKRKPLLNRVLAGLYTPGSIVKPYIALGALEEGVIDPTKKILSTGSISVPNPYFPDLFTVFKDNKAHGWVDMREALAVSSNVYFYEIGGGFEGQKGLGISRIERYIRAFGLGDTTGIDLPGEVAGIIPSPAWKEKTFPKDPTWRLGDTYNTAIGQYGFQLTPIQVARAVAAMASRGRVLSLKIVSNETEFGGAGNSASAINAFQAAEDNFKVVKEGMRKVVTDGTAQRLNLPYVKVAAKTGTAQVGVGNRFMNSWVTGFFPYENPRYAFAVLMEGAPSTNATGASNIMADLIEWMRLNTPEYL